MVCKNKSTERDNKRCFSNVKDSIPVNISVVLNTVSQSCDSTKAQSLCSQLETWLSPLYVCKNPAFDARWLPDTPKMFRNALDALQTCLCVYWERRPSSRRPDSEKQPLLWSEMSSQLCRSWTVVILAWGRGNRMNRSAWDEAEIEDRDGRKKRVYRLQKNNNPGLPKSSHVKYYFMLRFFSLL